MRPSFFLGGLMGKDIRRPQVMGVLNVTPDSFSDGGRFAHIEAAVGHGREMAADGAEWLDIGGESTRPGAQEIAEDVELARVIPVIRTLSEQVQTPISIDTRKPGVAWAAVQAGARMWNDITALTGAPDSLATAAELGVPVVLMHMQGEPATMQHAPSYCDAVAEVCAWLLARAEAAMAAGVAREAIWLDPGIGFGKRLEDNLALLRHLDRLVASGFPVLLGASRKRTVRSIDPTALNPTDRLGGSLAMALQGARCGVAAVRVHDVRETVQALDVQAAILDSVPNTTTPD